MFVDKCFELLDEEFLYQAMKALVSLEDGNRLVGIISHASEKKRIDRQIAFINHVVEVAGQRSWVDILLD